MNWLAVRARPGVGERDTVLRVLFALGSQGVHEDAACLVTYFPDSVSESDVAGAFKDAGFAGEVEYQDTPPVDWAEEWKVYVKAQDAGVLHVCPPWLAGEAPRGAIVVVIEPGMAFGTGEHASTRCALHLLQRHVAVTDRVVDLGAGSAVLSIAAARLGARSVVAIESDPDAIENATGNVTRNGVEAAVIVLEGDASSLLPLVSPASLIVANIISSVLLALLPGVRASLTKNGRVVLSGIMTSERDDFVASVTATGWNLLDEHSEDSWCGLTIQAL